MFKRIFLTIFILISSLFSFVYADALSDVLWSSSESSDYQIVNKDVDNTKVEWWVQKTSKIMLKLTIMIWTAVFLYGGIRFLLSMWDDSKAKKTRDTLIVSVIGFIIAFWAYAILNLMQSVWHTLVNVWVETNK